MKELIKEGLSNFREDMVDLIAENIANKIEASGLLVKNHYIDLEKLPDELKDKVEFSVIQNNISNHPNKGQFSDGYHTFEELYEHRYALFVALIKSNRDKAWRATANADGQKWEGWFVAGLFPKEGDQITYHLPMRFWEELDSIESFEVNPYFDGHTSEDVLKRLMEL
jgi:hypothetical protein